MGGSSSKESKELYRPPPPQAGQIQIKSQGELPKLEIKALNVAKPAMIKTGAELKKEAE